MKTILYRTKNVLLIVGLLISSQFVKAKETPSEKFSFAFLTDLHLNFNQWSNSFEGFKMVRNSVDTSGVDFVLTGGDNVDIDVLKDNRYEDAVNLYTQYRDAIDQSVLPWYLTIGNHDRYWHDSEAESDYGEDMFRSFFGDTYYSFDHKGWKFIVLNTAEVCDGQYCVSPEQEAWLLDLLASTPTDQPIVLSVHVPFLSLYYPVLEGRYTDKDTFINQKPIFDLFAEFNLKLVLQGHQHLYEEIKVKGVQFITAGAVSATWWSGPFHGTEEGYLKVDIDGEDFTWEYVDYGWEVKK